MLIQVIYGQLGVVGSYNLWVYIQFAEFLLVHIPSSIWIFYKGKQNFPEIDGFEGRDFPGKEKPQLPHPVPRESRDGSEERDNILPGGVTYTFVISVNESPARGGD